MISTGGLGAIPRPTIASFNDFYSSVGFNTGNLVFWMAVPRLLAEPVHTIPWDFNPDEIKSKADIVIFPASNQLSSVSDLGNIGARLEKTHLPILVLGLGSQAPRYGDAVILTEGTKRFLRVVAERSRAISVRGAYSAEILAQHGFSSSIITGCPSFFLSANPTLGRDCINKLYATELSASNVAICQGELTSGREDVERCLFLLASRHKLPYVCQAPDTILKFALGMGHQLDPGTIELLRKYLAPHMKPSEFFEVASEICTTFNDANTWKAFLSSFCLSLGGRLHGNILALQSGTLGAIVTHDSRTQELCNTGVLPTLAPSSLFGSGDLNDIRHHIIFDWRLFDDTRRRLAMRMLQTLRTAGLTPSAHLESLTRTF